jgi:hypothetical protein
VGREGRACDQIPDCIPEVATSVAA